MLYLMLDKRGTDYYAKVGLAQSPKTRRRNYSTHNPCAIMRSTCAGVGKDEVRCRQNLALMSITRIGSTEWFKVDEPTFNLLYEKGMGALKPKQRPIHFLEEF